MKALDDKSFHQTHPFLRNFLEGALFFQKLSTLFFGGQYSSPSREYHKSLCRFNRGALAHMGDAGLEINAIALF
jgi:hypothetical protein